MYYQNTIPLPLEEKVRRAFIPDGVDDIPEGEMTYGDAFSLFMERSIFPEVFWSHHLKQWMWSTGDSPQCAATWNEATDKAITESCERLQTR